MKTYSEIQEIAKRTILTEAETIGKLGSFINEEFAKIVELIFCSKGRLIVTGIGKSANIAQKIVATLNSTGTPAIFMHAADAVHGDLGIILEDDIVLCISKSGNTPEIKMLVPLIKNYGNKIIAMISNIESYLAKNANYILQATVAAEACPNNLAPTSSTTAQLVLGDALAVTLLECRGFSSNDFARVHPGGALGKQLYTKVSDLYTQNPSPKVFPDTNIHETIIEISSKRLGATAVVDKEGSLLGIITDGDLRRMIQKNLNISELSASEIMTKSPRTISPETMAIRAYNLMEENNITQLAVVQDGKYFGMIHLHDILKEGIV